MKKICIILAIIVFVYLTLNLFFSYTIFSIPFLTGKVFEGGDKDDFPICLVNPIKSSCIKDSIIKYVRRDANNTSPLEPDNNSKGINTRQSIKCFFERVHKGSDIKIVSIKTVNEKRYILVQHVENPAVECVVLAEKETNKVIGFKF